jgi:hypothetical protein
MTLKKKKNQARERARGFIEFMREASGLGKIKISKSKSDKVVLAKAVNSRARENNKLEKIITDKLPDIETPKKESSIGIDKNKVSQWLKAIKNFNQELSVLTPKRSVRAIVKKTIKEPSYVYPLAHSVKEKTVRARQKTVQKLSNNPWGAELVAVCLIALIAACYISRLAPDEANEIINFTDKIVMRPIAGLVGLKQVERSIDQKNFSDFIAKNSAQLPAALSGAPYTITITAKDLFGQAAGAYEGEKEDVAVKSDSVANSQFDLVIFNIAKFSKSAVSKLAATQIQLAQELKDRLMDLIK